MTEIPLGSEEWHAAITGGTSVPQIVADIENGRNAWYQTIRRVVAWVIGRTTVCNRFQKCFSGRQLMALGATLFLLAGLFAATNEDEAVRAITLALRSKQFQEALDLARASLRVIWRAWTDHTTYDPARHLGALKLASSEQG